MMLIINSLFVIIVFTLMISDSLKERGGKVVIGNATTTTTINAIKNVGRCSTSVSVGMISAQRVPEPDPLPGISVDTRPDPIQFWKSSGSG